ncbi:MAG: M1 family metallopeptidase [Blastocatellia bacterium]
MIATVADRFRVLSNGKLSGVQAASAGYKTWHWKMDEPFSSYLISVVVGEFAEVVDRYKDTPVLSYVYPDQLEQARLSLSNTASMVAFFSRVTGTDYPFSKHAQATVRDYPGGLENTTATILMDTVVHDRRAHLDVSSDSLVAHELAHQWFGGLLICHDWGELWLNEGFATFFENLWAEHDKGKDDSLYGMLSNHEKYFEAWSRGNHRPMVINRYWDPGTLFDAHVYQRGGAVLNMLRMVLGDEAFFNAIRHYVKKYRAQDVKTAQLITAIEEGTGQNLAWFFDEWVYKIGHPEFEITANYDEAAKSLKLTVKQTQKADANSLFPPAAVYVMPVNVAITTASGEKVHRL